MQCFVSDQGRLFEHRYLSNKAEVEFSATKQYTWITVITLLTVAIIVSFVVVFALAVET